MQGFKNRFVAKVKLGGFIFGEWGSWEILGFGEQGIVRDELMSQYKMNWRSAKMQRGPS